MAIGSEHADLELQRSTALKFVADKFRIIGDVRSGNTPHRRYIEEGQFSSFWRNSSLLHVDFTPEEWAELEGWAQVIPAGVQEFLDGVPAFYVDHSDDDAWRNEITVPLHDDVVNKEDTFLIVTALGRYWAVAASKSDLRNTVHSSKYLLEHGNRPDSASSSLLECSESEEEEVEDEEKPVADLASLSLADEEKKARVEVDLARGNERISVLL
jgi:hypothetical protein